MHSKLNSYILQTVAYGDVFDYPLTQEELWKYLIAGNVKYAMSNVQFQITLKQLLMQKKISVVDSYYCLHGRERIITVRKQRRKISEEKIKKAKKIISVLKYIPTILGIGVTGSVSMSNANNEDDIDFLIITQSNTLWVTRLLILFTLEILGLRRKHTTENASNLICVNMFVDESQLALPNQFHNLYGAHEVIQITPLLDKKYIFTKFIQANNWVQNFLPNSNVISTSIAKRDLSLKRRFLTVFEMTGVLISFFEPLARQLQLQYMKKRKTREVTTPTLAAFHPVDFFRKVMAEFTKRVQQYGL